MTATRILLPFRQTPNAKMAANVNRSVCSFDFDDVHE